MNTARLSRTAVNAAANPGVLFTAFNTALDWKSSGTPGIVVNVVATGIALTVSLAAAWRAGPSQVEDSNPFLRPQTAMIVAGAAQLIAAAAAMPHMIASFDAQSVHNVVSSLKAAPFRSFAAPLCFGAGNPLAPINIKSFRSRLTRSFLTKEILFAFGMWAASGSLTAGLVYGCAAAIATGRNWQRKNTGALPLGIFAAGSFISAIQNIGSSAPTLIPLPIILAGFGAAYASLTALECCGGFYQAGQKLTAYVREGGIRKTGQQLAANMRNLHFRLFTPR